MGKYFQNLDTYAKPVLASIWFEKHQALLLHLARTKEGRDLLCLNQAYNLDRIDEIRTNRVSAHDFFQDGEKNIIRNTRSHFFVGGKFANIINFRWREFQALASEYYAHLERKRLPIPKELVAPFHPPVLGNVRFDTLTTRPNANPESTCSDGRTDLYDVTDPGFTWAGIHDATDGIFASASETVIYAPILRSHTTTYRDLGRGNIGFDISDTNGGTMNSGSVTMYGHSKNSHSFSMQVGLVAASPASNTDLVVGDFDQYGTTLFATVIAFASWDVAGNGNVFNLNASGLNHCLNKNVVNFGLRDYAYDISDTPSPLGDTAANYCWSHAAEATGTANDPTLYLDYNAPAPDFTYKKLHLGILGISI